jgi:hypothetical protein
MPGLPARPLSEHLRKEAKRVARTRSLRLADAQRVVAKSYGFRNWTALLTHVARVRREERAAGARATQATIVSAAAHRELNVLRALVAAGQPIDAPTAATLGEATHLREVIRNADARDVQLAFGLAVINGHVEAVRIALAAGADVGAYVPIHTHSTALHQAALDENVALIELLLSAGARTDVRDTLWDSTPIGWAIHQNRPAARALLEQHM